MELGPGKLRLLHRESCPGSGEGELIRGILVRHCPMAEESSRVGRAWAEWIFTDLFPTQLDEVSLNMRVSLQISPQLPEHTKYPKKFP